MRLFVSYLGGRGAMVNRQVALSARFTKTKPLETVGITKGQQRVLHPDGRVTNPKGRYLGQSWQLSIYP